MTTAQADRAFKELTDNVPWKELYTRSGVVTHLRIFVIAETAARSCWPNKRQCDTSEKRRENTSEKTRLRPHWVFLSTRSEFLGRKQSDLRSDQIAEIPKQNQFLCRKCNQSSLHSMRVMLAYLIISRMFSLIQIVVLRLLGDT